MQFTAVLIPAEEGGFVAFNPETGTTTQGESIETALPICKRQRSCIWRSFRLPRTASRS